VLVLAAAARHGNAKTRAAFGVITSSGKQKLFFQRKDAKAQRNLGESLRLCAFALRLLRANQDKSSSS
jgi:hypothetical protein